MPETAQMWIIALVLGFWGVLIWKVLKNKLAPVKTVRAVVKDKQKIESFTKYRGTGKAERYCIVFEAQEKRLSFYVSRFSYAHYRINDTGTLKYKGDRIIDFS
jgi:hypothetical protein